MSFPAHKSRFTEGRLSLLAETAITSSSAPGIEWEYVWFGGAPLAQINVATGAIHTYVTDHLGTPVLTTDASGAIDWRAELEPYGEVFAQSEGSRHQPLRFPGQEAGPGQEYYNVFRWYRSGWGRYTQADPIGLAGDLNTYAYAQADPISLFDPTGEKSRVCCTPITDGTQPFNHCFVQRMDDAGESHTYSLHRMSGGVVSAGHGCTFRDDDFDQAAVNKTETLSCGEWSDGCLADACVESQHTAYPRSSEYRFLGTNSNTYASHIAFMCGMDPPPIVGWQTPGWGKSVPKRNKRQCPEVR